MSTPVPYKHWYLLAYMVQQPGSWVPHSIIAGSDTMELSIPKLNAMKEAYSVPQASVLISVSYLGWMSENGANGKPDINEPTAISEAYRLGMTAATKPVTSNEPQPVNPYNVVSGNAVEVANAAEWQQGFADVRRAQAEHQVPAKTEVQNQPSEQTNAPVKHVGKSPNK